MIKLLNLKWRFFSMSTTTIFFVGKRLQRVSSVHVNTAGITVFHQWNGASLVCQRQQYSSLESGYNAYRACTRTPRELPFFTNFTRLITCFITWDSNSHTVALHWPLKPGTLAFTPGHNGRTACIAVNHNMVTPGIQLWYLKRFLDLVPMTCFLDLLVAILVSWSKFRAICVFKSIAASGRDYTCVLPSNCWYT